MDKKLTKEWAYAAIVRAIRTMAQVALSMFSVGMAVNEVDWIKLLSVSLVAGVYSILTSVVTTLPEVGTDGVLAIDDTDPDKTHWQLSLQTDPDKISKSGVVKFKVDTDVKNQ